MRRWLPLLLLIAGGILLLGWADDALARVGGGQDFSRRMPSGGGGRGGGGEGVPIELVFLLVQLIIRYPAIGVPLALIVVGVLVARMMWFGSDNGHVVERMHRAEARAVPRAAPVAGLDALRQRDPGFSLPVLLDFVVLVHRRALEALGTGKWEPLAPFVSEAGRKRLAEQNPGITGVSEVITGGVRVLKVEQRSGLDQLVVRFESTRVERTGAGQARALVEELWTFRRKGGVTSPPPERMESLACPSCGAPIEVGPMGDCQSCGAPITKGQLQWQLAWVEVQGKAPATIPSPTRLPGGEEPSVRLPTFEAPNLAASLRRLVAGHPELDLRGFQARAELVYGRLQEAWSAGRWERARPFVTDRMFQTLRFWMDGYAREGLRNRLEDVELDQLRMVRVESDAYYQAITVRIWGSMRDSVVDGSGRVIGGNPNVPRKFSEYWTFLRSANGPLDTKGEAAQCPSCGAPLDRVDETGVCGYCSAKITSGRFDWVLARIEQPEAYR